MRILENIFSIKNTTEHKKIYKVITLAGIKIKHLNYKKMYQFQTQNDAILKELALIKQYIKVQCSVKNLPSAQGNLKLLQDASVAILNYLNELCTKNGIKYWLDSGTLIGNERHNGFIPWDDDIDIAMLREDYLKFHEVLNNDSSFKQDGFYFRAGEITQIFYKDSPAQVDIFPMDIGYSTTPPKGEEYTKFVASLNNIKGNNDFDFLKWEQHLQPVSDKYLNYCYKTRDELLVPKRVEKGFIFYGVETLVKNRTCFCWDDIFPLIPCSFYGIATYKPKNTPYYLFCQYGDYMSLPDNFNSNHGENLSNKLTQNGFKNSQEAIEKYFPKEFK